MAKRPSQTVYVFQGGGALGAYQAGFVESLEDEKLPPDWLVGTSIGAINAALIAGNAPADRLKALRKFWDGVTRPGLSPHLPASPFTAAWQTWPIKGISSGASSPTLRLSRPPKL